MAVSPQLGITHLTQSQNQKHVTVNSAIDALDNAAHRTFTVALDNDGNTTIAESDFQGNMLFDCTGTLSMAENVNLPTTVERLFLIRDSSTGGFQVTVQVTGGGGASVAIESGTWYLLHSDGTDVLIVSKSSPNVIAYSGYAAGAGSGAFSSSQTVLRIPIPFDITFPANFAGAYAVLATAATASTTFDVRKANADGGSEGSIGSIIFAASANQATFATDSGTAQSLTAGQILIVRAPGSADATADEIGYALVANKDL